MTPGGDDFAHIISRRNSQAEIHQLFPHLGYVWITQRLTVVLFAPGARKYRYASFVCLLLL
jgi:hypothetical protein